jgi:hypothetical protein
MQLCVHPPVQTDEAVGVAVVGIVMGPMHDWKASRIVDHFAANLDAVPGVNGTARRDADVVDDFNSARAALHVERFMHCVRSRTVEKTRLGRNGTREIHPRRHRTGIRSGQVHASLITRSTTNDKIRDWERS